MMRESPRTPEIVTAYDPLDLQMQRLGVPRRSTWSKVSSRAALLLVTGVALGPEGLAVLTPEILAVIQPAIPVALAVLGVTAVFESPEHGAFSRRAFLLSSTAILATGLATALRQRAPVDALEMVGQAALIAILLAGAGWILSSRGASDQERQVFSIATLLLIGGVADYLSVSGLLLGWVAAGAWRLLRTTGAAEVRLDAAYVQHPVMALLLVTAGAQVLFSWQIALVAVSSVCLVFAGILVLRRHRPAIIVMFDRLPLAPAAFTVALAMDAVRLDQGLTAMLSVVVLAAASLDVLSGAASEDPA
jgi:hypothetical protein